GAGSRGCGPRTIPLMALMAVTILTGGCGEPSPTTPPAPVVTITPPTITSLAASPPRVAGGETLTLTATAQDPDTPVNQLAYNWSAAPLSGTFTGSGPSVKWVAPH